MVDHTILASLRPSLFGYIMSRVHCADIADDIVQDTLLRLMVADGTAEDITKYAFRSASNCLADYFKRRLAESRDSAGGDDDTLQGVCEDPTDWQQCVRSILRWIVRHSPELTNGERQIMEYSILCEDSVIASNLGMAETAIRMTRSRACSKLRAKYADRLHDMVDQLFEE